MDFKILGPLQLVEEGGEVQLRSAKERMLLAVLLLHAPAVVSRDRLVDELWRGSPPPTADKALNVHVSQLRKTLAHDGGDPVRTRPPGYALEIDPEQIDARLFEQRLAEAHDCVAGGDVEQARSLLDEALALWRGRPLEDLELEPTGRVEVARLEELRFGAQMDRVDCDLALGRHTGLIAELEKLVAEHPLHERVRAQLILALYRSGRQADALECYRAARHTLVEELGIEPSAPLQRLEQAILNHDASLEAPRGIVAGQKANGSGPPADAAAAPAPLALGFGQRWPSTTRRRRLATLTTVLVLALAAAVVLVLSLHRGGQGLPRIDADSVGILDEDSGRLTAEVPVGSEPAALTASSDAIWVANEESKTVSRIDPTTNRLRTFPVSGHPSSLSALGNVVWVANGAEQTVLEIRASSDYAGAPRSIGPRPPEARSLAVSATDHGAWVAAPVDEALRLDSDARVTLRRSLSAAVVPAIAAVGRTIWVGGEGSLTPLDSRTGIPAAPVALGGDPTAIVGGFGSIWVAYGDEVQRVDPEAGVVRATIRVGHGASALAADGTSVWAANASDGTVSRIDPRRDLVARTVRVGGSPVALAARHGNLWIAVR